jgi:hypothetical protein
MGSKHRKPNLGGTPTAISNRRLRRKGGSSKAVTVPPGNNRPESILMVGAEKLTGVCRWPIGRGATVIPRGEAAK